jgi:hypothetical protein
MKTYPIKAAGLIILLGSVCAVAGERIKMPDDLFYHRFASSIPGPEASWVNPAGLGDFKDFSINYIATFDNGRLSGNYALNITGDGLAVVRRTFVNRAGEKYDEYVFAAGAELGRGFFWGGSYRYFKKGPESYNKKHFWNMGFQVTQNPVLSCGVLFSNLNRAKLNGERTDIEQLYSITYALHENILKVSVEMSLSTGQSLSSAEYNYGAEFFPTERLAIYGNLRNNGSFEIGLSVNLGHYRLGGQSRFNSDGIHQESPLFVGYTGGTQSSREPNYGADR